MHLPCLQPIILTFSSMKRLGNLSPSGQTTNWAEIAWVKTGFLCCTFNNLCNFTRTTQVTFVIRTSPKVVPNLHWILRLIVGYQMRRLKREVLKKHVPITRQGKIRSLSNHFTMITDQVLYSKSFVVTCISHFLSQLIFLMRSKFDWLR